jgi:spore maturation protein CgeB
MTATSLKIAFFGSSLVSSYWNGAAGYYRGLLRALAARGHAITFYEPDAFGRQQHRDLSDPSWARVVVYPGNHEATALRRVTAAARHADVLVKASGVGVYDALLEQALLQVARRPQQVVFWDIDPAATLARVHTDPGDPFRSCIPCYDAIFTYGGGKAIAQAYLALGAQSCVPVHDAVDPEMHHPVPAREAYASDLSLLANWPPDPQGRVAEYYFGAAQRLPRRQFLLGGRGWDSVATPANVRSLGEVPATDYNALHGSARAILHVAQAETASLGCSPSARLLQAAAAGACLITHPGAGSEPFLEPDREVLVARSGAEVAEHLESLSVEGARELGDAARRRVLAQHTYAERARQVEALLCAGAVAARFDVSA